MAQRRHHYECAFESHLRASRIPYISIDEARKSLLPRSDDGGLDSLKSFDFVTYAEAGNLLIDVKGRRAPSASRLGAPDAGMESWVTAEDIRSLSRWETLFGQAFQGAFAFLYWRPDQPPDGLFDEVFEAQGRWYVLRIILLRDYIERMRTRSARWETVALSARDFGELCCSPASRVGARAGWTRAPARPAPPSRLGIPHATRGDWAAPHRHVARP